MKKILLLLLLTFCTGVQAADLPAPEVARKVMDLGESRVVYKDTSLDWKVRISAANKVCLLFSDCPWLGLANVVDVGEMLSELRCIYNKDSENSLLRSTAICVFMTMLSYSKKQSYFNVTEIVAEWRHLLEHGFEGVRMLVIGAAVELLQKYPITDKELVAWVLGACDQEAKEQVVRCQEERARFLSLLEPVSAIGSATIAGDTEQETGLLKALAHPRVGRTLAVAKVVDGDMTKNPEPFAHAVAAFLHGEKSFGS